MTEKSELGQRGEELACAYLVEKGYRILERNFRQPWGELDIVAIAPDKTLVFVEVKTMKMNFSQGLKPEDQMSAGKIQRFKKAASLYAGHNQSLIKDEKGWRLDLIAITMNGEKPAITHYENVV
jgi:putative endonuclease